MKKLRSHRHQFHSICRKWLADQIISQDVGLGNRSCQSQMKLLCNSHGPFTLVSKLDSLMDEPGRFCMRVLLQVQNWIRCGRVEIISPPFNGLSKTQNHQVCFIVRPLLSIPKAVDKAPLDTIGTKVCLFLLHLLRFARGTRHVLPGSAHRLCLGIFVACASSFLSLVPRAFVQYAAYLCP